MVMFVSMSEEYAMSLYAKVSNDVDKKGGTRIGRGLKESTDSRREQ